MINEQVIARVIFFRHGRKTNKITRKYFAFTQVKRPTYQKITLPKLIANEIIWPLPRAYLHLYSRPIIIVTRKLVQLFG